MRTPIATAVLLANAWLPHAALAQNHPDADASIAASAAGATQPTIGDRTLDPVVVTAARMPQPLAAAIPQTTVFSTDDIAKSGVADLPSLLALAPGAQIVRNGGPGAASSLLLRGAASNQTLVLIDGVRVDSASLGAAQLSQIMLDQIGRVEIVSGNVSALYGSNAIGGVVQIFTKDGGNHPPQFNFETELGSYHTQRQQVGVNGALDKDGDTTFNLTLARVKTDGFSAVNPALASGANPNANGFLSTSVGATLKHKFNADWDAGVRLYESTGNVSYDNAFGLSPLDLNNQDNHVRQLSVFANGKLSERWTTHLTLAQGDDQTTSLLNDTFNGRFNTKNQQLNWQNEFALAAGQKLLFGYERLDQSLDSDSYSTPERHVNSGFVGYDGRLGASQIQLNVRRDQYSDFGGANSYYAGYGYNFDSHWKAIVSVSDAFRAPTFNDLYFPDFGNPDLKPEHSHSVEAALQYASERLGVARLSVFQTRYSNLIGYSTQPSGLFAAANVGRAKVQGLEGSWSGHLGATNLRASFTLQNPVDLDTNQDLNDRARHFATLSANRTIAGWRVGGEWLVSGARNDGGMTLGGYGILNLSARYNFTKSWFVAVRVDNLTNRDYELAYTYNTPKRGAYVTIGWQQQ